MDPRLAAHARQLGSLQGVAVAVDVDDGWSRRREVRKERGGVDGLRGASLGDAGDVSGDAGGGVGGLGVGGLSGGGGGGGDGTWRKRTTIDFSDLSIEGELVHPEGSYVARKRTSSRPLRGGSSDDNEDFAAFLRFLDERTTPEVPAGAMRIDVAGRRFVSVVDVDGRSFPSAAVVVRAWQNEQVVATATTLGDGVAPFYPPHPGVGDRWLVEASDGERAVTAVWSSSDAPTIRLQLPTRAPTGAVPLDVLFLVDTTGSMGDEIDQVKQTLLAMTAKVRQGSGRAVDLRYGAVLYRDVGDDYLTARRDFTADIDAFDASLKAVRADGGGDTPESLNQGLAEAMVGVSWRPAAAKVAFLVADAPPHMDYVDDVPYGESLQDAVTLGIRIHAVAASGLADDPAGSLVFRQIAQYTRGRFIFIEYGQDVVASAEAHGVKAAVEANNLDDILLREIRREIDGWGRGD